MCSKGLKWIPGSCSNLNIWEANWIPKSSELRKVIAGPLNNNNSNLLIKDIWTNGKWALEKISFNLPVDITNCILTLHPNIGKTDKITWVLTGDEKFISKSCYNLSTHSDQPPIDFSWIWELKCPRKMKFLLWKCRHNKLPTRSYLSYIGINIDPTCPVCKQDTESIEHIFCSAMQLETYGIGWGLTTTQDLIIHTG